MIHKGDNAETNRGEGIKLAIEILKTQPELLFHSLDGKTIASCVISLSESLIEYVTEGKSPATSGLPVG